MGRFIFTQDDINSSGSEELIIVNTIADLQNINTTSLTNATVRVLGYYTPNDGGEGDFIFNSTSTSTPDNGAIVEPETGPGRWFRVCADEINVLWYGCKGDGATDNSQYLQAANSYAQAQAWNLYVPEGNYAIDSNPAFTVPVRFACNAIFSWSGFSMPIDAIINDYTQHFACTSSATVAFKNVSEIYPEWFGALGDGSLTSNTPGTDNTAPVQSAVNSAIAGNWIVFNSAKKYWCGQIIWKPGVNLKGTQPFENDTGTNSSTEYQSCLQYNSSATSFIELSNSMTGGLRGIVVQDLVIDGNSQATVILNLNTKNSLIRSCTIRNAMSGIAFSGITADSSLNQVIGCNLKTLATAISATGATSC